MLQYQIYRAKFNYGRFLNLEKPVDVSLELSSACNLSCKYCYHNEQSTLPFKKGLMDLSLATKII